jgi:hypothetical protein
MNVRSVFFPPALLLETLLIVTFPLMGAQGTDLQLHGEIKSHTWVSVNKGEVQANANSLSLKLSCTGENYRLYAQPELLSRGLTEADQIDELEDTQHIFNLSYDLREAYVDLYNFILPVLDIRIGKQIIVWGTGDAINPTGNLCPSDINDILDFGETLGVSSFLMNMYLQDFTLSLVFVPAFTPSRLPGGELLDSLIPQIPIPGFPPFSGTTRGSETALLDMPEKTLDESAQYAAKLLGSLWGFDISLSYYRGRYTLPVYRQIEITTDGSITDILTRGIFPKFQAVGFDFAGSLWTMGVWGEAALFFPEKVVTTTYLRGPSGPLGSSNSTAVKDVPYARYVLGTDYSFRNGLYSNIQYVYGLDSEIGVDSLNHYLLVRLEKSLFYDKLKVLPLTLILSAHRLEDIVDDHGIAWVPEIRYRPRDNLEIDLGVFLITGKGMNLLARLEEQDSLFFNVKVSF